LTLSLEKTHVVGIDDGFDFLGFHIRRMRKRGTMKSYVYTVPAPQGHRGRVQLRSDPLTLPRQPDPNPHTRNQRMTNDQDTWRARCLETGTSGSAGGDEKTDNREVARRFVPDPTRQLRHVLPVCNTFWVGVAADRGCSTARRPCGTGLKIGFGSAFTTSTNRADFTCYSI